MFKYTKVDCPWMKNNLIYLLFKWALYMITWQWPFVVIWIVFFIVTDFKTNLNSPSWHWNFKKKRSSQQSNSLTELQTRVLVQLTSCFTQPSCCILMVYLQPLSFFHIIFCHHDNYDWDGVWTEASSFPPITFKYLFALCLLYTHLSLLLCACSPV